MDKKDVYELIDRFQQTDLTVFEYESKDGRLRLEKGAPVVPQSPVVLSAPVAQSAPQDKISTEEKPEQKKAQDDNADYVKAPLVGVFYQSSSPGKSPFVEVGDRVKKGSVMCIIEAMKVMNEIKAPSDLIVKKVLGVDGEMVECGTPLFEVEKC